jgi:hypothetical protein
VYWSYGTLLGDRNIVLVSWQRYYTRFWKQSMLFCDTRWPDLEHPQT